MSRAQLLRDVQNLEQWIDRYTDTTDPERTHTRKLLWSCLEWRLRKLNQQESSAA